ncbi:hypothetical protein EES44_10395 [Streptomyces sp. ADI96-15]|uniref:GNAT family N-acetyltransferase n=1 Tax=Streptomyces sp. ADI96-15 TaxID=1522761 RepID=UPI000F558E3F|nr:GNAT family protein [Streptomyces sp. ADI96-15]RPK67363.1 hypothetical protein EES44_10395 [Streptomyces sp. ADI96-15]
MEDLGPVAWPPTPIRTERLVLRASEARDRPAFVELYASPEVHTYLGGARPRDEIERAMPAVPARWPGSFVVELDGTMTGQILLRRAPGSPRPAAEGLADLGYLFLPHAWGLGYATEACAAALAWCDGVLPGEPLVLTTRSANTASLRLAAPRCASLRLAARLGFTEVERYRQWGAEQWLGLRSPPTPSA